MIELKTGSYHFRVPVVGITGGIGSGKSIVANLFRQLGAFVIDADAVGKKILETDITVKSEVVNTFGCDIVNNEGTINRERLGEKVFKNDSNLQILNHLIHPPMIRFIEHETKKAIHSRKYSIVVVDAALLFEAGVESKFDYIITVVADLEKRIQWVHDRGLRKRETILARINAQMPQEEKASHSDFVLENNGTIEELEKKARQLFQDIVKKFSEKSEL